MGGFGSGRHDGGRCTDDMRPLDVRKIHRAGLLKPAVRSPGSGRATAKPRRPSGCGLRLTAWFWTTGTEAHTTTAANGSR